MNAPDASVLEDGLLQTDDDESHEYLKNVMARTSWSHKNQKCVTRHVSSCINFSSILIIPNSGSVHVLSIWRNWNTLSIAVKETEINEVPLGSQIMQPLKFRKFMNKDCTK